MMWWEGDKDLLYTNIPALALSLPLHLLCCWGDSGEANLQVLFSKSVQKPTRRSTKQMKRNPVDWVCEAQQLLEVRNLFLS